MTIIYKSGKRHTDADCLLRSLVEPAGTNDVDVDAAFLGIVDAIAISQLQRHDPELLPLNNFLEGQSKDLWRLYARGLPSFCLRNDVLYNKNFSASGSTYLLVIPASLREEILKACQNETASGHLD